MFAPPLMKRVTGLGAMKVAESEVNVVADSAVDESNQLPSSPRHSDTMESILEGGRVRQTLLMAIQCAEALYSGTTTVPATLWLPYGV